MLWKTTMAIAGKLEPPLPKLQKSLVHEPVMKPQLLRRLAFNKVRRSFFYIYFPYHFV